MHVTQGITMRVLTHMSGTVMTTTHTHGHTDAMHVTQEIAICMRVLTHMSGMVMTTTHTWTH